MEYPLEKTSFRLSRESKSVCVSMACHVRRGQRHGSPTAAGNGNWLPIQHPRNLEPGNCNAGRRFVCIRFSVSEFTAVCSLLHSFEYLFDFLTGRFWEAAYGIGFLPPGLNLNAIPKPARVVMITCDLFPRYIFIRMTEPEEAPSLNYNLLRRKVDFLRNQSPPEKQSRQEGCFGTTGLNDGNLLLTREVVPAILTFPSRRLRQLGAFRALFPDDSPTTSLTYLGLIWDLRTTFRTRLHRTAQRQN